jgi:glyoxylase-like metal-dependent hydrolase (beta-lactamase superfamily II)
MIFRQFLNPNTGCASYLLGCASHGAGVVVDPQYEIDQYIDVAERYGLRILAVIDTHVHADHLSGDRRLSKRTGASLYLHGSASVTFPFTPLEDDTELTFGNVTIRALHTPGHTPESVSLLITDLTRGSEPWMVLTGDTLFVGDVGRPDFGGPEAAGSLYDSLQGKILNLPDHIEVYPAHISGSACGRAMSGKPSSTIGFEKRFNRAVAVGSRDEFVEHLYDGLPPKPAGFSEMIESNRGGRKQGA